MDTSKSSSSLPLETPCCNTTTERNDALDHEDSSSTTSTIKSLSFIAHHPMQWFVQRTQQVWNQLTLQEISGSLGDLGTLIPLVVAMSRQRSIVLGPSLFFAGVANVITGYVWDVPMCVQPMKSIAAVALAENLSRQEVTAAGVWMGLFMVVLGVTQLIEIVNVIVPSPVVSGLQIGVGLRLATKGIIMVADLPWASQMDCIVLALLLSICCMYWLRQPQQSSNSNNHNCAGGSTTSEQRQEQPQSPSSLMDRLLCRVGGGSGGSKKEYPVGIYLFVIGGIFSAITLATTNNLDGQYNLPLKFFGAPIAIWALEGLGWEEYKVGLLEGAIPQLPLTTLNSVISVCCLAHQLYPEKRRKTSNGNNNINRTDAVISRREVSISVGLMNLLLCPFGGMPNCQGAGGLAGQHRMGARHGSSVVFLGFLKICLAIFFGASALTLLDAYPDAVLGVMLAIAGQELATTGFVLLANESMKATSAEHKDENDDQGNNNNGKKAKQQKLRENVVIAIVTAMVIVAIKKTHYGALSGWVTYMVYGEGTLRLTGWLQTIQSKRRQRQRENRSNTTASNLLEENLTVVIVNDDGAAASSSSTKSEVEQESLP